jgi:plastocyanin
MRQWLALLVACLALGVVVAGCGGDAEGGNGGGGDGGGAAAPEQEEQPARRAGPGRKTAAVAMRDTQFNPAEVRISAGDTVRWTNEESLPHDVDGSGPGGDFSSGPQGGMSQGDTYKFTFREPGAYEYVCRVHAPGMAGTVTVR